MCGNGGDFGGRRKEEGEKGRCRHRGRGGEVVPFRCCNQSNEVFVLTMYTLMASEITG